MIYKRFYIESKDFEQFSFKDNIVVLMNKDLRHRLCHVLRLKAGDELILFTDQSIEYLATINEVTKNSIVFKIKRVLKFANHLTRQIIVFFSLIKKSRFEWALEKLTELGVYKIVPIVCARTVVKIDKIPQRFKRILIEASEQSGRTSVPAIEDPLTFSEAVRKVISFQDAINILFDSSGEKLSDYNADLNKKRKINIFVGPEGGFTDAEITEATRNNFEIVKLSPLILRAETAAIVGAYLVLNY